MHTIKTSDSQSIIDVAIQYYGDQDAFVEIIRLNDLRGKMRQPVRLGNDEIDLAYSFKTGTEITIDETSPYYNAQVVKEIATLGENIATGLGSERVFNKVFTNQFA